MHSVPFDHEPCPQNVFIMVYVFYKRPFTHWRLVLPVISKSLASLRNGMQILHNPTDRNIVGQWWGHQPFENFQWSFRQSRLCTVHLYIVVHCTEVHAQIQETGSFIFHALCFASVSMVRPAMLKLPGLGIVYCTNVRADTRNNETSFLGLLCIA